MQKAIIFILGFIFISNLAFSQLDEPRYLGKAIGLQPGESEIGFIGNYFIESNSLNGTFNNAVLNGKFLSDEIKNSVKLKGDNIFGSGTNVSFSYSFRSSKDTSTSKSTSFQFGVADKRFTDITFSDDVFKLLLYGNSNLPEANLDNFNLSYLSYQKIFGGIAKRYAFDKYEFSFYGGLAVLKGQESYSFDLSKGFVNTNDSGDEVNVGLNYSFNSSDTIGNGMTAWRGTGISADIAVSFYNFEKLYGITMGVYNLGQIYWNEESLNVSNDTSFSYIGQEVDDFMDFSSTDLSNQDEDSLLNEFFYDKSSKKKYSTTAPAQLFFNYIQTIPKLKSSITVGAKYLLFTNMKTPYYYLRTSTEISKNLIGIVQLADGGYGKFQVGLGCNVIMKKNLSITLFTSSVQGFLHNDNTYNQGVYASISYKF